MKTAQDVMDVMHGRWFAAVYGEMRRRAEVALCYAPGRVAGLGEILGLTRPGDRWDGGVPFVEDSNPFWRNHNPSLH